MLNKVELIGNLGNNPETKNGKNDTTFVTFSVATSETFKNKAGEKESKTEWHNVVANGKLAELVSKYLTKGKKVYVEGKLTHSEYEDKDKIKRYSTNIQASNILFLSPKDDEIDTTENN